MKTAAVGTYQVVVMVTSEVTRHDAEEPGRVTDAQVAEDVNMSSTEPRREDRCQPNKRSAPDQPGIDPLIGPVASGR